MAVSFLICYTNSHIPDSGANLSVATRKNQITPGFTIGIWAIVPDARSMTLGDKGTVFVGSRSAGNIYAITQNNGERQVRIIANRLKEPTGVAF